MLMRFPVCLRCAVLSVRFAVNRFAFSHTYFLNQSEIILCTNTCYSVIPTGQPLSVMLVPVGITDMALLSYRTKRIHLNLQYL